MSDPTDAAQAAVPPPPSLPETESPRAEEVLADVPSKEDVVERAKPAQEVVAEQPSREELLGERT
ncbi:hypothetical protein [Conexibacter sp. SYSU D00693]|uniref:hypothetical protein n=1 Tax=Conexibacter sp. SYSU D00693 TaxID=2812560 RepID=UPI00196A60B5|nr:hypothetical protein [Conexibacter sp. SYSU D00693]